MKCGKLTAKLRDAVPVRFYENGREIKRYKNIEIPGTIKELEFTGFKFDVPESGPITFKIYFRPGSARRATPTCSATWHRMDTRPSKKATTIPARCRVWLLSDYHLRQRHFRPSAIIDVIALLVFAILIRSESHGYS